jgi:hypothetical protein
MVGSRGSALFSRLPPLAIERRQQDSCTYNPQRGRLLMRTLSLLVLLGVGSMAGLTQAQGPQLRGAANQRDVQERQRLEQMHRQEVERRRTTCDLPDGTSHRINAVMNYEGQIYQCVEVFAPTPPAQVGPGEGQTLIVQSAGWIKVEAR